MITAIADIQVMTVADQQRILSQPTMVTSSSQSKAFTETGDPQTEQKLARDSVVEAATTIVDVIRKRRATNALSAAIAGAKEVRAVDWAPRRTSVPPASVE